MQEVNFLLKGAAFGVFVVLFKIEIFLVWFDQNYHVCFILFFCICCWANDLCNLSNFLCSKIITQTGTVWCRIALLIDDFQVSELCVPFPLKWNQRDQFVLLACGFSLVSGTPNRTALWSYPGLENGMHRSTVRCIEFSTLTLGRGAGGADLRRIAV